MKTRNHSRAMLGLGLNALFVIALLLLIALFYKKWDSVDIKPDTRLIFDEKLLHILHYEVLPLISGAMILSARLFWKLRK